jgi:PhoPQ-activated pathogenicity-related protein
MFSRKFRVAFGLFLFLVLSSSQATTGFNDDVLENYVNTNDGAFSYQQVAAIPQPGATIYVYRLASQKWRSESEIDRTVWEHRLTIVVPDIITNNKAILFTSGGENTPDFLIPESTELQLLGTFALLSGTIAAQVNQVPSQPLTFSDEPQVGRIEDDLVAYSWDTAMGTGDYTWAAYLPMTKSVIKAMDAMQMAANDLNLSHVPDEFVLVGFSKRGAITWLSAAVDDRVVAISPGVFDTLNFAPSTENQRATYGEFAETLIHYDTRNVLDRIRTIEGQELIGVIDPYEYRHRVSIPKYIINASGDQFYPPDSSHFYINNLIGETLLRYVPNTDHGGANAGFENAILGLLAWYQRIITGVPRPTLDWHKYQANNLSVTVNDPTATAVLWSANNPNARDFRLETFGPNWQATPMSIDPDGTLEIALDIPATGWSGYFVEVTFQGIAGVPDKYSTPVFILPDTRPFTLIQPRIDPKSKSAWQDMLIAIINGEIENQALVDSFPIRAIGDETVPTVNDAYSLLSKSHVSKKVKAQQECLAVRLNIKDGQMGWYTQHGDHHPVFFWKLWNLADVLYRLNLFPLSELTCRTLNR